jgi:hypothetical protein
MRTRCGARSFSFLLFPARPFGRRHLRTVYKLHQRKLERLADGVANFRRSAIGKCRLSPRGAILASSLPLRVERAGNHRIGLDVGRGHDVVVGGEPYRRRLELQRLQRRVLRSRRACSCRAARCARGRAHRCGRRAIPLDKMIGQLVIAAIHAPIADFLGRETSRHRPCRAGRAGADQLRGSAAPSA